MKTITFQVTAELPDDVKEYRLANDLAQAVKKHASDYVPNPVRVVVDWVKKRGKVGAS